MAHPRLVYANAPIVFIQSLFNGGMIMGQRIRPTAADTFASADFLRGIVVVSSFGFWAVMLGLMPVLVFRVWLA
ncbi:hypothetical protein BSZ25_05375 [Bradyrhizobium canariense]|jgi:hypothetical protein|nr:hypothetical protein BSZ25_05375 [Bradyrhizobium canariense]